MGHVFSTISILIICLTILGIAFLVLLALPSCKLRSCSRAMGKYVMPVVFALLVVSPIDIIPDVIPVLGLGDDVAYILAAITAFRSARSDHATRKNLPPT